MPVLVMKFGGTSVANIDRIRRAAKRVGVEVAKGYDVIVIVSAMSGRTNELVGWVDEVSPLSDAREYDAVVSSGDVTRELVRRRAGSNFYHLGPDEDKSLLEGLPVNWTGRSEEFFVHSPNVDEGGMFDGWGRRVVLFPDDGHPDMCNAVLDITGDCRDEVHSEARRPRPLRSHPHPPGRLRRHRVRQEVGQGRGQDEGQGGRRSG